VLWLGLVGDPSSGKSPGLDPLLSAVARLERSWLEPWEREHRLWREAAAVARAEHDDWQAKVRAALQSGAWHLEQVNPLGSVPGLSRGLSWRLNRQNRATEGGHTRPMAQSPGLSQNLNETPTWGPDVATS
jgi:hypothetical protein